MQRHFDGAFTEPLFFGDLPDEYAMVRAIATVGFGSSLQCIDLPPHGKQTCSHMVRGTKKGTSDPKDPRFFFGER